MNRRKGSHNARVFVSVVPFGEVDRTPISLLDESGLEWVMNPLGRKLKPHEVEELAADFDGIIAGTEDLRPLIERSERLKIISRVGIGLDSVPLAQCEKRGITVTYTPDAVTVAVAELAIGVMVSLTRHVCLSERNIREGVWKRLQGKRIGESTIGIVGLGRIGTEVCRLLVPFHPRKVLVNDLKDKRSEIKDLRNRGLNIAHADKKEIYRDVDILSLHIPITALTKNMINARTFTLFRPEAFLINLARGGIVNETDLYDALMNRRIAGAAVDCFEQEPYSGPLLELRNVLLTPHIGSCSFDCRSRMETEATRDIIRFFQGEILMNRVPKEELLYQSQPCAEP